MLILSAASALAYPVEVTVEPVSQAGKLYSPIAYNMTITNNQGYDDIFQIVYSGDKIDWITPGLIAKNVHAWSSEQTEISFYPTGANKGKYEFEASVNSIRNPGVKASAKFYLDIAYDFNVKSFSSSVSGDIVSFVAVIQTPGEKEVSGTFALRDSSGNTLLTIPFTETVNGEKTIERIMVPDERLLAGTHTSSVSIGNDITVFYTFSIPPVRSVSQTVEETSSGFSKDVVVSITNDGNVVESGYVLQQSTPLDPMTGMMTRPDSNCREDGGAMVCSYLVGDIRPGVTAQVTYTLSYWPAFNGYIILTVIVISLVLFSFLRVTTPRIMKNHSRRGEDRHNIFIRVKNPFFHRLNDVVVRDWVSPLAQVLHEEIESTRPVMRKLEDGTELIWKLGEMKPREERILQYKVRSLIHGSLKMPGAHLKFTAGKSDKKLKLISNSITLG
jgi:hypothetical protein